MTLLERVIVAMANGEWQSLEVISKLAKGNSASVSARIREIREEGEWEIHRVIRDRVHYYKATRVQRRCRKCQAIELSKNTICNVCGEPMPEK